MVNELNERQTTLRYHGRVMEQGEGGEITETYNYGRDVP